MQTNQNKTTYIIFRIFGVVAAVVLIAGIAFSAYRFGQQRCMLAASESAVMSGNAAYVPWAGPFVHWYGYSMLGDLLMICAAIFLMRMAIGLILGPRPHFRGRPNFRRCHYRWCAAYPWGPYGTSKDADADTKDPEDAGES